jgi:endonuclease/exonuclease/phosphatase family metal-dependent hydrolase
MPTSLIRTWNLFHGNADPPRRCGYLRAMVELAAADRPAVLCLQELPVWALPWIDDWSEMQRFAAITRPPLWPGRSGGWVTRLHQGFFRSGLAGQANAILVARGLPAEDIGHERISGSGRERRLVQAVRVLGLGVVANLHASNEHARPEVPLAEVEHARRFATALARPDEPLVLAGDFNVVPPAWPGWSSPGAGIDQVLVRGAAATAPSAWPRERRLRNGVVLSDHAPVELVVETVSR